jgi:Flp pilus assembly protein TadD
LREGRAGQAIAALQALVANSPNLAEAHYALASALSATGDKAGAEAALRATLAASPTFSPAAAMLATRLTQRRAAGEALAVLQPFIGDSSQDPDVHSAHGAALKMLGRLGAASAAYARAADLSPNDGIAEHNLAGVLGDAQDFARSEAATRRAFAKGLDAPETWLVRGRALQGLGEFDEAEAAFHEAIHRRPTYADAQGDLAQLIWMRTEDASLARVGLDAALSATPGDPLLSIAKARLLEFVGDQVGAYAAIVDAIDRNGFDIGLHVSAANLIAASNPALALDHAVKALAIDPASAPALTAMCQVNLALGRADVAATLAENLCRDWPRDQYPVALAATAWRILGDPRYRELYNYERVVQAQTLEVPDGWSSLESFLGDLAARLRDLQVLKAHPIGQSLRAGTQTGQSLALTDDPIIGAFLTALDVPIRTYIKAWRRGKEELDTPTGSDYRFAGAWSALLRPGGYHTNHLHPMGWISSACHIEVPKSVDTGREGWLTFGEPGIPTQPSLPAEHFVKPVAGVLVLFPSYMWHGTVPFSGETSRLTTAFDVVPA